MKTSEQDPRVYGPVSPDVAKVLFDDNVHADTVEKIRGAYGVTQGAGELAVGLVIGEDDAGNPTRGYVNLDPTDPGTHIRARTVQDENLPDPSQVTFPEQ